MRTWKWLWAITPLAVLAATYMLWSMRQQPLLMHDQTPLLMHEITFEPPIGNPWYYNILPPPIQYKYGVNHLQNEVVVKNLSTNEQWKCKVSGYVRSDNLSLNGQFIAIEHEENPRAANNRWYCSLFERPGRLLGYFQLPDNKSGNVWPSIDGHAVIYQRYNRKEDGGWRQAIFVR